MTFIAIVFAILVLAIAPLAMASAEGHAHNQDGWQCVESDDVRELTCDHEHDALCGFDEEGQTPCIHTHDDSCYILIEEGEWTCTSPIEEDDIVVDDVPAAFMMVVTEPDDVDVQEEEAVIVPAAEPVVDLDGVGYATLEEAVDAAKANGGGTITLLQNIVIDEWDQRWDVNNLTINGEGHALYVNKVKSVVNGDYLLYRSENLRVSDLTICFSSNGSAFCMNSGYMNNVNVVGGTYGAYVGANGVTVRNCTFDGQSETGIYTPDNTGAHDLLVDSCDFINTRVAILWDNERVTNCTVSGDAGWYRLTIVGNGPTVTGNTFDLPDGALGLEVFGPSFNRVTHKIIDGEGPNIIANDFQNLGRVYVDAGILDLSDNYWSGTIPDLDYEGVTYADKSVAVASGASGILSNSNGYVAIHTYYVQNPVGNSNAQIDHDWGAGSSVAATCLTDGHENLQCKQCDLSIARQLEATGHDWGEWEVVTPAAIGVAGEERSVCKKDSSHVQTRPIEALSDGSAPPADDGDDAILPGPDPAADTDDTTGGTTDDGVVQALTLGTTPGVLTTAVADAATIADDPVPLAPVDETIPDDANPLANLATEDIDCWVHRLMFIGMLITSIYGVGVILRRRVDIRELDKTQNDPKDQDMQGVPSRASQTSGV